MKAIALTVLVVASLACAGGDDVADVDIDQPPDTTSATTSSSGEPDGGQDAGDESTTPDQPASSTTGTADDLTDAPTDDGGDPVVGTPDLDGVTVGIESIGTFDQPVDLVDHDGAIWIVEQGGRVIRLDGDDPTTVADVSDRTSGANEQGLLGIAFRDGAAYLNYTATDGTTTVSEFPIDDAGEFDVDAERVVIEVEQPFSNHNAGDLLFDPDGNLLIPLGDGGSGGDPLLHGPDPSTLLGTIVRIDPTPSGDAAYSIPADNPFAAGGDGRPEVWSWGLRNPWRIDLDPATGDLWIADVGQSAQEEVNLVRSDGGPLPGRAGFYGWSALEGDLVFNTSIDAADAIAPVHTYDHGDDGCSVSGGAVYRGDRIDGLAGAYVYGDFCSGRLWAFDSATGDNVLLRDDLFGLTAVRRGADGELYALQHGGDIWRIVPGDVN